MTNIITAIITNPRQIMHIIEAIASVAGLAAYIVDEHKAVKA